jgi:hypothetical protein
MVCAFLDQTKHVYDRRAEGPRSTPGAGLVTSTAADVVAAGVG